MCIVTVCGGVHDVMWVSIAALLPVVTRGDNGFLMGFICHHSLSQNCVSKFRFTYTKK